MEQQSLMDYGGDERETGRMAQRSATRRDLLPSYGWTEEWFARIFLLSLPVQESRQEAAALRNFARWERRHGRQPQTA
jgi:hypothetical protein